MLAMLPGGFAAVVGFLGLGASSAAVRAFDPALNTIAQPLLLASIALVGVSGLRCTRTTLFSALAATFVLGAIAVTASATLGETSDTRHHPKMSAPMDGGQTPMAPMNP